MDQLDMERAILRRLYAAWFSPQHGANIHRMRAEANWDEIAFQTTVRRLTQAGLIRSWRAGGWYRITTWGALYAEAEAIVPEALERENQHIRMRALQALAQLYETAGPRGRLRVQELSEQTGLDVHLLEANLIILADRSYVERIAEAYRVTPQGLQALKWLGGLLNLV